MSIFRKLAARTLSAVRSLLVSKHLVKRGGSFVPLSGSKLIFAKGSTICLRGVLRLGANCIRPNGRSSIVRMDKRSRIDVNGDFSFFYGADVILFEDALLELGAGFINSDCRIRCHEHIRIGEGCAISHEVTIMDSDAHLLNGKKSQGPVIIEDHVWIGTRVTILNNVTIGEGSVVAAGSIVTKDVPSHSLVAGVPAKVIKNGITWAK